MKTMMMLAMLGLSFLGTSAPVERGGWDHNGVRLNGVELGRGGWDRNGVRLNGVRLNGVRLNGVRLNGVRLNGEAAAPGSVTLDDARVVGGRFTR